MWYALAFNKEWIFLSDIEIYYDYKLLNDYYVPVHFGFVHYKTPQLLNSID